MAYGLLMVFCHIKVNENRGFEELFAFVDLSDFPNSNLDNIVFYI
jgi:hypothetical protein